MAWIGARDEDATLRGWTVGDGFRTHGFDGRAHERLVGCVGSRPPLPNLTLILPCKGRTFAGSDFSGLRVGDEPTRQGFTSPPGFECPAILQATLFGPRISDVIRAVDALGVRRE
jgi:hypothetical protein